MSKTWILVAEDDVHIRQGIMDTLESDGYEVIPAGDGEQAFELFSTRKVDLVLLDVMMPKMSGYDVCRAIRAQDGQVPVIMLTAKGEEIDKVVGLKLGADDYITKPFGIHELLARIGAVLRRCRPADAPSPKNSAGKDGEKERFLFSDFTVDPRTYKLEKEGFCCDLSKRELELIRLFARHPGEVLERDDLLNRIWGYEYAGTTRTLDQHIAMLRKKIEMNPSRPKLITTVHGIGYRYEQDTGPRKKPE